MEAHDEFYCFKFNCYLFHVACQSQLLGIAAY